MPVSTCQSYRLEFWGGSATIKRVVLIHARTVSRAERPQCTHNNSWRPSGSRSRQFNPASPTNLPRQGPGRVNARTYAICSSGCIAPLRPLALSAHAIWRQVSACMTNKIPADTGILRLLTSILSTKLRLLDRTQIRLLRLKALRILLLSFFVRYRRRNDDVIAVFPVGGGGHLMLSGQLQGIHCT
jgi:hypothetical protein